MKKESKANLIFVSLLVLSMIPGIFLLVRKKLNGDTSSAALPDPVPYAVAYNQPPPCPPNLPRKEPLIVRDWVQRLTQENVGIDVSMLRQGSDACVSQGYFTQALSKQPQGDGFDLWLLIWRDTPKPDAGELRIEATPSGTAGKLITLQPLDVPKDIRHALQAVGYIDPPEHVWIGQWRFEALKADAAKVFALSYTSGKPAGDTLTVP